MKKLILILLLFVNVAQAQQPEAERAMLLLQSLQIPASQAEIVVEVKREIIQLQKLVDAQKKAIKACSEDDEAKSNGG